MAPHGHYTVDVFVKGKEISEARFYSAANNAITNYILAKESLVKLGLQAEMSEISIRVL